MQQRRKSCRFFGGFGAGATFGVVASVLTPAPNSSPPLAAVLGRPIGDLLGVSPEVGFLLACLSIGMLGGISGGLLNMMRPMAENANLQLNSSTANVPLLQRRR